MCPKPPDLPPPTLIEDEAGLDDLLADLDGQAEIAVDTEADSFFSYQEKVCLIQITVEDRDYLVDPLADVDVARLGDLFADPKRTKVFHDGEYDVLILKRDYNFDFAGLFDTRIAAAALGEANPGLASVLGKRFGVELDKSLQRSNWKRRPLSTPQIAYARLDTRFLIPLMHEQKDELAQREREMIVEGECRRLEQLEPPRRIFHADDFARIKGARVLKGHALQRLRELFVSRDRQARRRDVPPFKVMSNKALLAIAEANPKTENELARIEGFSPRLARRLADSILKSLERAREKGALTRTPSVPPKNGAMALGELESELHDRLKAWRKRRAEKEGLDSSLVLNRHVLERLAEKRPAGWPELEKVDGLLDWQLDLFGRELLDVVHRFEKDVAEGKIETGKRRRRR